MDRHPCVIQLRSGCHDLGLPSQTALELVRFLLVKRFVGGQNGSELSPSSTLAKLWHWMLLETAVRESVEELVGKVSHTQKTATQSDDEQVERR